MITRMSEDYNNNNNNNDSNNDNNNNNNNDIDDYFMSSWSVFGRQFACSTFVTNDLIPEIFLGIKRTNVSASTLWMNG